MKKTGKRLGALCIVLLCFFALFGCSSGDGGRPVQIPDNTYVISDLRVDIDASKGDRSMRVTEKYTFEFRSLAHGFYRDIPLNSGEKVRDLRVYNFHDFYSDYVVSRENGNVLRVRVGSEDAYIKVGKPLECTIEYTLITPKHAQYKDALVLNVIGQGWACSIERAEVHVKLPAETNQTPEYYFGGWGESRDPLQEQIIDAAPESGRSEYSFTVNGLQPFNGFTVYYFLPAGALKTHADAQMWIVIGCAVALVGVAVLLKLLFGRSPALAPVTNFYPPKSVRKKAKQMPMDPVEMGYLIDNTCQGSDVTSLIFYFASKGYLEIEADEEKRKSDFTLHKMCDLPEGVPSYQRTLFNKIFSDGDTVTVADLTNRTYTAVTSAQKQMQKRYAGKLYDVKPRYAAVGLYVLTALFVFLTLFFTARAVSKGYSNFLGFVVIFPIVPSALIGAYLVNNWLKLGVVKRTLLLIALAIVATVPTLLLLPITGSDVIATPAVIAMMAAVVACCLIAPFIARRTKYYTDELNEILGFKDFLQTAEKERLEMLLEENPQYYYDILPYANVLGVSDIWQDKFKGLTLQPPSYYRGVSVFDLMVFNACYRSSYRAYSAAVVSRPSSSSRSGGGWSGGGGGGGFSGGGFGGGGGGKW